MSKQSWIILILLVVLNVAGYLSMRGSGTPDIRAIKADPALFDMADYDDKIALHTRLSTLFPRGTKKAQVQAFFEQAGVPEIQHIVAPVIFQCHSSLFFNRLHFAFDRKDEGLWHIQVDDWPPMPPENCGPAQDRLTPAEPEEPHYLKMEELAE